MSSLRLEEVRRHGVVPEKKPGAILPRPPNDNRFALETLLEATLLDADASSCFVVETHRDGADRHGLHTFADLAGVSGSGLALICRDPDLAYLDLSRAVFLDTETTGLGLGSGTYVFLVGAGYFRDGAFRVRQFFLRGPGDEPDFLSSLADFLSGFAAIVTFNGKAFDWPLLENRYIRQRRPLPLTDPPHVDLLHPARRLWKRRLESCALSSLEGHVLRMTRTEEDVPGYLIPSLYFGYLRSGDGRQMKKVFYHNLHDVLSLAALTVHIDRLIAEPMGGLVDHGVDYFCLGRAYERAEEADLAALCYEEALRRGLSTELRQECLLDLGAMQKRRRWWDAAVGTWYRLLDDGGDGALTALVELAKYHEHVERDYDQAMDEVRQALTLLELRDPDGDSAERADLEHRYLRLLTRNLRRRARDMP